jgi:hypothetical protein
MSVGQPTGFTASALPFWGNLDDGAFEQYCTELLNLHPVVLCSRDGKVVERRVVSGTRLLSGTSQRGGDIRATMDGGEIWVFQCKRVKEFGPTLVKQAADKAENEFPGVTQYVLVTTCGLSEQAQKELTCRGNWMWWDSSRLTTETQKIQPTENGIMLVHRFFKSAELVRSIFPWGDQPLLTYKEFFAQELSAGRNFFHHRTSFVPWTDAAGELERFARGALGRALVLSAPGGQGKSRLLLQVAEKLERDTVAPRIRFVNIGRDGFTESQADYLRRQNDMVLVLEDAHRLGDVLADVAKVAAQTSSRLVVVTRPQAREIVLTELQNNGYLERIEPSLILPRWPQTHIHKLAENVLQPEYAFHAPRLAILADRCPLFVVMGAALLNSGRMPDNLTDEREFRERVVKGFVDDFLESQDFGKRTRLGRLIRLLSFISPAKKTDELYAKAAQIIDCSPLDIAEELELLEGAGLVVGNREGIRLYPDLFSDAVLLDACLHQDGEASFLFQSIVSTLDVGEFPALMRNVAQADWEARTKKGAKRSLFDPIWIEFEKRFRQESWSGRSTLLREWSAFSVFQPERTFDLARLALSLSDDGASGATDRAWMIQQLPAMLKPVVLHAGHANAALTLLWSLEAAAPRSDYEAASNPVSAIASVASFDNNNLLVSKSVLDWLNRTLVEPHAIERIRQQPWILEKLLKPFFARVVEQHWSTGRTVTFRALPVRIEATRPLRDQALAMTERFLCSPEEVLCSAGWPLLVEAIRGIDSKFRYEPSAQEYDQWRADRLRALEIARRSIAVHSSSVTFLLRVRRLLRRHAEHDFDAQFAKACEYLLSEVPDTFELRIVRALTSLANDEIRVRRGPDFKGDYEEATKRWDDFVGKVAGEAVHRLTNSSELIKFLRRLAHLVKACGLSLQSHQLVSKLSLTSATWCSSVLNELISGDDDIFDDCIDTILRALRVSAPNEYDDAVRAIVAKRLVGHLCALVQCIGTARRFDGGISQVERETLLRLAETVDGPVLRTLARIIWIDFETEPIWAAHLLSKLKPKTQEDACEIRHALARIVERPGPVPELEDVIMCIRNLGEFCAANLTDDRDLEQIAKKFPRQVYEHFRDLLDSGTSIYLWPLDEVSFGDFADAEYVEGQLYVQWKKAVSAGKDDCRRLPLIRCLLCADTAVAEKRIHQIAAGCVNSAELEIAARLVATAGSRFVFQHPELVRIFFIRSKELGALDTVPRILWNSACGGSRGWSSGELDSEYRYILEESRALAKQFAADVVLASFYREIAQSEHRQAEENRRWFREEEDEEQLS